MSDDKKTMNDNTNEEEKKNKEQEIEIVTGNGKDLEISPVYDHIKLDKPDKDEKKQDIVIPQKKT